MYIARRTLVDTYCLYSKLKLHGGEMRPVYELVGKHLGSAPKLSYPSSCHYPYGELWKAACSPLQLACVNIEGLQRDTAAAMCRAYSNMRSHNERSQRKFRCGPQLSKVRTPPPLSADLDHVRSAHSRFADLHTAKKI